MSESLFYFNVFFIVMMPMRSILVLADMSMTAGQNQTAVLSFK